MPNLMFYLKKNLDRGLKDISLFEIGPIFKGNQPGQQLTVIGAIKSGKISRLSWNEKDRLVDVFDAKKDAIQTLIEAGYDKNDFFVRDNSPSYYHPGKSGSIYLDKDDLEPVAYFGEIHPNIIKKLDIKNAKISANSEKLNINQQISLKDMSFENVGNTKDSEDYKKILKDIFNKAIKSAKNKVLSGNTGNAIDKLKNIDENKIKEKIKEEINQTKDKVKDKLKKLLN